MTVRVALLDDERAAREYLAELLEGIEDLVVVGAFAEPEPVLELLREGDVVDAVFADIDLGSARGEASGLTWAARFAETASRPSIVMATAHPGHALPSFDLGAVDYLLKPWTRARVAQAVARVRERRPQAPTAATRIAARQGRTLCLLDVRDVLAFEARERLVFVHTERQRFDVDLGLASFAASFGARFLRVHRQWLVAVEHVREVQPGELGMHLRVGTNLVVPCAAERTKEIRDGILAGTVGLRR